MTFLYKAVVKIVTELNIKQEKFCLEYSRNGNATQAYKVAYKVQDDNTAAANANRLLRNDKIQARLKELSQEIKSSKIADTTECQELLTEIARSKKIYPKDRVAALNTLLKAQGAFSQNVNISGTVPIVLMNDVIE